MKDEELVGHPSPVGPCRGLEGGLVGVDDGSARLLVLEDLLGEGDALGYEEQLTSVAETGGGLGLLHPDVVLLVDELELVSGNGDAELPGEGPRSGHQRLKGHRFEGLLAAHELLDVGRDEAGAASAVLLEAVVVAVVPGDHIPHCGRAHASSLRDLPERLHHAAVVADGAVATAHQQHHLSLGHVPPPDPQAEGADVVSWRLLHHEDSLFFFF